MPTSSLADLFQKQDLAFTLETDLLLPDTLRVVSFQVKEAINALYSIQLQLVSRDPDVDLEALMDTPMVLACLNKYDETRFFHGIAIEAEMGMQGHHWTTYTLTLAPELARLQWSSDSRIFQQVSVPDIMRTILEERGITHFDFNLSKDHKPREYCVQYRETHLEFLLRIASEEGIYFHFRHEQDQHELIFSDNSYEGFGVPHTRSLPYNNRQGGVSKEDFAVLSFGWKRALKPTKYSLKDYSFHNPANRLIFDDYAGAGKEAIGEKHLYDMYDFPGRYKRDGVGKAFAEIAQQSARIGAAIGQGTTTSHHLSPGFVFGLTEHDAAALNQDYRVLTVHHQGEQAQVMEEDAGEDGATTYACDFTVMAYTQIYSPPILRRPRVDGPQMAHVVGPEGEEIYCDEYGRVKIHFHWDRYSEKNEHSSCWIRVSQNWAGGAWGHMAIPRIGQEVMIEFLEGDPDQPIVTGRTYHQRNKPPYKLPDHKTRMTIKSDTHKGKGFNELRFEDEANQEEIYIHGQKDMNTHVENDSRTRIDRDGVKTVGGDYVSQVTGDEERTTTGNVSIAVGKNPLTAFLMSKSTALFGKAEGLLKGLHLPDALNLAKGNMQVFVEKSKSESVGISSSEIVGVLKSIIVGNVMQLTVGKKMSTIVRGRKDIDVGRVMNINVGDELNIRVGKTSSIHMNAEGEVIITGLRVKVKAKQRLDLN